MRLIPVLRPKGFSLVELMIAMTIGLLVLGAVLSFVVASVRSNLETVNSTRLTQELRVAMNLMTREIRRAGYDRLAERNVASSNPGIRYTAVAVSGDGQCIVFGYNRPQVNAGDGAPISGEFKGFRRAVVNGRGVLQANVTSAPPVCNADAGWINVTRPNEVDIEALVFRLRDLCVFGDPNAVVCELGPGDVSARVRDVSINLQGALSRDGSVSRELVDGVRIRTDDIEFPVVP